MSLLSDLLSTRCRQIQGTSLFQRITVLGSREKQKQNKNTKQEREKNARDLHQLKKNIYKKLWLPQASIVPYSYCDLYKWQDTTNMKGLSTEHK